MSNVLSDIPEALASRFGEAGSRAADRLRVWLSGAVPFAYPEILEKHLAEEHLGLLFDAFWQIVPFGTGGRRGTVGYGPNRINPTTIAMTVQGHCEYLKRAFSNRDEMVVIVANDVRVFNDLARIYMFLGPQHPLLGLSSRALGRLACEVYAANGIVAYFADPLADTAVLSTPELSYLIGKLAAIGGVNISASHNPPDDNGIKVYDEYGSQPIAPNDQRLLEAVEGVSEVRRISFDEALREKKVRPIPAHLHQEYVGTYVNLYANCYPPDLSLPIVYTPLCGCGLTTVGDVLGALRFPYAVPPKQNQDGSFEVIPFRAPNPEVPQATDPAKSFADDIGSGIVLASDPDADRVGLEVKLSDGSWYHCDGNQIAAILAYYLILDPEGPQRKGLVIETLVTTRLIGKIVEKAGGSYIIDDLLVGFKYVADVLKKLKVGHTYKEIPCTAADLVLATEESHGVIIVPSILDKDATPACMYLAALYQRLYRHRLNILDYYVRILDELGAYADMSRSIMMTGADGVFKRDRMMDSLREEPIRKIYGEHLERAIDHWDQDTFGPFVSETDRLPRNVIQFIFKSFIITVRPSGTEPKLKFYCQLQPDGEPSQAQGMERLKIATLKAERLAITVYKELLNRIGVTLGEPALLLPDIIDLDRKKDFELRILPELRDAIASRRFRSLSECLDWLREGLASLTPGADPLPALRSPLSSIVPQWLTEIGPMPILTQLERWAQS